MNWDLTGKRINGVYMGLFPYKGTVMSSRVKYGGDIQHSVALDEPVRIYGQDRDVLLVNNKEINRILDADEV